MLIDKAIHKEAFYKYFRFYSKIYKSEINKNKYINYKKKKCSDIMSLYIYSWLNKILFFVNSFIISKSLLLIK